MTETFKFALPCLALHNSAVSLYLRPIATKKKNNKKQTMMANERKWFHYHAFMALHFLI
jgi:hypothetical protein